VNNGGIIVNGLAVCAGIGGIELGLKLAIPGYQTVGFIEKDLNAADTLFARMKDRTLDGAEIWNDVRTFDARDLKDSVDILSSGFPCQPWSVAGKQRGVSDERWIWPHIARIIHEIRPQYVLLENVMGLRNKGVGHILRDLAQSGYDAEWDVFSAAQCGAPHLRERLFMLAYSHGKHDQWLFETRPQTRQSEKKIGNRNGTVGNAFRLPYWPPRPQEYEKWGEVLEIDPTLKPAFYGVAHGVSPRLEQSLGPNRQKRLRALGNAVVPIVAAVAFLTLLQRALARSHNS